MARRFIPLTEVSEILDISSDQAYALVRSGDLPAIKVGGRGQWRVETVELEAYIQRMYARTREMVEREQRSGSLVSALAWASLILVTTAFRNSSTSP